MLLTSGQPKGSLNICDQVFIVVEIDTGILRELSILAISYLRYWQLEAGE